MFFALPLISIWFIFISFLYIIFQKEIVGVILCIFKRLSFAFSLNWFLLTDTQHWPLLAVSSVLCMPGSASFPHQGLCCVAVKGTSVLLLASQTQARDSLLRVCFVLATKWVWREWHIPWRFVRSFSISARKMAVTAIRSHGCRLLLLSYVHSVQRWFCANKGLLGAFLFPAFLMATPKHWRNAIFFFKIQLYLSGCLLHSVLFIRDINEHTEEW